MRERILVLALAGVAALLAVAPASGAIKGTIAPTQASGAPLAGTLNVDFKVHRFVSREGRLFARATVIATHTSATGETTSARKPVLMKVGVSKRTLAQARTCLILRLRLDALMLNLLGAEVKLQERVVLTVTGNPRGGILGRLFCSLARGQVLGRQAPRTARQLNATVLGSDLGSAIGMGAPLSGGALQQLQEACPILELILGPLDLRLLGLRVHLTRVHLTITAYSDQGLLGSLLCSVANTEAPTLPAP